MPKKKINQDDLRYWVRMDNHPTLAELINQWSTRAGYDYPASFIRLVLRRFALQVAKDLGVATEEDEKKLTKNNT